MEQTIARLLELIRQQTGLFHLPFNPGLDDSRIDELWKDVNLPLPDDYRTLLRVFNGTPGIELTFPPAELKFLSLEWAVDLRNRLAEFEDDEEPFNELNDDGRVRRVVYHTQRFPIADDEIAVQTLFLDFIPGDKGQPGQLIFNPAETYFYVVASSLHRLMKDYVTLLEKGLAKLVRRSAHPHAGYVFQTMDDKMITLEKYRELLKGH